MVQLHSNRNRPNANLVRNSMSKMSPANISKVSIPPALASCKIPASGFVIFGYFGFKPFLQCFNHSQSIITHTPKSILKLILLALGAFLLLSGCQTSPVASVAPPAVTNAVPAPITSPPMPQRSAVVVPAKTAFVAVQPVVPPSFLITISVSNSIGWGETNVFWWMGKFYGSHEIGEIANTTNNFYTFSNQWDSRYPCFVSCAQFYTNGIVNGRKGYITNGVVGVAPFYFAPITTSNIVSPFVYQSVNYTNIQALPVSFTATYCFWASNGVSYAMSEATNLLTGWTALTNVVGSNGVVSWVEPSQGMMFYRVVIP